MSLKIYLSSGGGVRVGATFGAQLAGETLGVFQPSRFDYFAGTSAGALDAALTANDWTAEEKVKLFVETDFTSFFTPFLCPFSFRKLLAVRWPIHLKKLIRWIDHLNLKPSDQLFVNTVDSLTNTQVIYCETLPPWIVHRLDQEPNQEKIIWVPRAFSQLGYGTVLARSMAMPGLEADAPHFKDGGIAENPLLSIFPNTASILMMNLGFAGDTEKKERNLFEEVIYAYEFKSY